jgi:hypothetical protein
MSLPQTVIIQKGSDWASKHPYITGGLILGVIALGGLGVYYLIYKPAESFIKFFQNLGKGIQDAISGTSKNIGEFVAGGELKGISPVNEITTQSIASTLSLPAQTKTLDYLWGGAAIQRGSH